MIVKNYLGAIAVLAACSLSSGATCLGWSTGYFAQYDGGNPSNIAWSAYTHIAHFALIPSSTGALSGISASQAQALVVACHLNKKKALLCIGGAGTSPEFSSACANAATQTTLVKNILNFMRAYGYDGVDMDWECGEESDNAAMVAKFKAFHKQLRDSVNTITPRPMMTAAVADWYPNACASIVDYCDQMNGMSYYGLVNTMDGYFNTLTSRGVPKAKLGVGYGYDSDNEVDLNNPTDIGAKCNYAIANGYGGVMIWLLQRACAACIDSTARYVCPPPTYAAPMPAIQPRRAVALDVVNIGSPSGIQLRCTISTPAGTGESPVDLSLYDVTGAFRSALVHGSSAAGIFTVPLCQYQGGLSLGPGTYVVKLTTGSGTRAARVLAKLR